MTAPLNPRDPRHAHRRHLRLVPPPSRLAPPRHRAERRPPPSRFWLGVAILACVFFWWVVWRVFEAWLHGRFPG